MKKIVVSLVRQLVAEYESGFAAEENARAWHNEDHTDGRDLKEYRGVGI